MKYFVMLAGLAGLSPLSLSAEDEALKFHPIEAYCIDYEMTGNSRENGWVKSCSRKFGAEVYFIEYAESPARGPGGVEHTEVCHFHRITLGDQSYMFDMGAGKGVLDDNTAYPLAVAAAAAYAEEGTRDAYLRAHNFEPTSETKNILDRTCLKYMQGDISACYTDDLLMLEFDVPVAFGMRLEATRVAIGESGADANYRLYETLPFDRLEPGMFSIMKCTPKDEYMKSKSE